ncbi:serine/threonine protein kinase [Scytonema hofmannii PCC 7110]|uniref:non-specific serine/threonine protein kinase n=1 Tax=Scytonema hofmannii PCC 7110 TaxID=128403 RepID=A0A139X1D2_9CYAN|nr:IMS domain-containing protein [Scytonema hofmannii]KYC38519.1 serine/threonine protein kinase [Scytonema hofmannii PCC 7110]
MITPALLNNRYKVLRVLGSGGFGETFLAEDTQMPSSRCCVIKQLKPVANNPQIYQLVQQRFQQEAAILEELGDRSDRIPRLYAYFSENGQFYLVQEYIEGQTLSQKVYQQGLLSESEVKDILINILPILDFVHSKRIVHRDIKPDNIILRFSDGKPVLIDFGAVKLTMQTEMASGNANPSIVIGTPGFMPTEQSIGRPVFSSDIYSLGLTAIYLLTGRMPQQLACDNTTGETLWRDFAPHVSPGFADVLDRAIRRTPSDRYSSVQQMLVALQTPAIPVAPTVPVYIAPTVPVNYPALTPSPPSIPAPQPTVPVGQPPVVSYQQPAATVSVTSHNGIAPWQQGIAIGVLVGACVVGGFWFLRGQTPTPPDRTTVVQSGSTSTSSSNSTASGKEQEPSTTQSNNSSQQSQQVNTTSPPAIAESEARNLINKWLQAKRVMFAPPYDSQPAAELTTGSQYESTAGEEGSINSLKKDGHSYKYGVQTIDSVDEFSVNGDRAILQVKVTEDRTLLDRNGNILPKETDFKTRTVRYTLEFIDGRWKIASTEINQ